MRAALVMASALVMLPTILHFAGAGNPNRTVESFSERRLADQHVDWQLAYTTSSAVATETFQGWDADTIREVLFPSFTRAPRFQLLHASAPGASLQLLTKL